MTELLSIAFRCFLLPLAALLLLSGCEQKRADAPDTAERLIALRGNTMGTTYSVKVVRGDAATTALDGTRLKTDIDQRLAAFNQEVSTYIETSRIARFNTARETDWIPVGPHFAAILDSALQVSRRSMGAFDVTVGPLVNLWGFGPEEQVALPDETALTAARQRVGYQNVMVHHGPPAVRKTRPDVVLDFSAIAKGYGVDLIAAYLDSLGATDYMVEIGGEVVARGANAEGVAWRIGISTPDHAMNIQKVIALNDRAVATSGDYMNYFEKDGVRYSHTIDPRTGRPVTHKLASVTVAHESCAMADAYATAIDVLGPLDGYRMAMNLQLPIYMIIRDGDAFVEKMTPEFEALFASQPQEGR